MDFITNGPIIMKLLRDQKFRLVLGLTAVPLVGAAGLNAGCGTGLQPLHQRRHP